MKFIIAALLCSASLAHAAYYVECGTDFNEDEASFKQVVFKASSESERFSGRNSADGWSVGLGEEWLADGKAKGRITGPMGSKVLTITVSKGQGQQEIGKKYVVDGMYDDYPTLKVMNVGGVAANVQLGTYECYTSVM